MPDQDKDRIRAALAADERRAARDSYRACGGSNRRALKTFMTADEKRERRQAHAETVRYALEKLETVDGLAEWWTSRALNPDLSPCNAAICAADAPRQVVATAAGWQRYGYRVRKGEAGSLFITAPGFWPKPAFVARQTDAPEGITEPELPPIPARPVLAAYAIALRAMFAAQGRKGRVLTEFATAVDAEPPELAEPLEPLTPCVEGDDELPF